MKKVTAPLNLMALRGFTLIELLIVITIVGILIVGLVPRIVGAPSKARDAKRLADLSQISTALESYFSDEGEYPDPAASPGDGVCTNNAAFVAALTPDYMRSIPSDSQTNNPNDTLGLTTCDGQYTYEPLVETGGVEGDPKIGFILVANVENDNNGNNGTANLAAEIDNVGAVPAEDDTGEYYFVSR